MTFDCGRYYKYNELRDIIGDWAVSYSELLKMYSIGQSHQGRDIWVLEISAPTTVPNDEKPGFFIDANTHAEELTGSTAALQIASELLRMNVFFHQPRISHGCQ